MSWKLVKALFIVGGMLHCSPTKAQTEKLRFKEFTSAFIDQYARLQIPNLQLSYVDNLDNLGTKEDRLAQETFFKEIQASLLQWDKQLLSKQEQLDYFLIQYEAEQNLHRLKLASAWSKPSGIKTHTKGIYQLPNGKQWYVYFLKKWVDQKANPDQIYHYGLRELDNIKQQMQNIQDSSGFGPADFNTKILDRIAPFTNKEQVKRAYQTIQEAVAANVFTYFPENRNEPDITIAMGTNKAMAIAPAYYNNNTFYFNFFTPTYSPRQMGWVYLHEAIPGHHYQINYTLELERSEVQNLFHYYGFTEGWGAYVEQYGVVLGAYSSTALEYGRLEWDLIRTVRLPLDVGINYYGWDDQKALSFWKTHIKGKDTIALREIKRIRKWPAQVVCYKYGANKIQQYKGEKHSPAELKSFHAAVLQYGDIPFSVLEKIWDTQ